MGAFFHTAIDGLKGFVLQLACFWPLWLFVAVMVFVNISLRIRKEFHRG